ncbi:MAG: type III secretion protein [Lachnospiraceae bacterium]|jgi:flagellar biosynthesis protein|nr:type III secretion protein [Lachnospiraceae bacterium]
MSEFDELMRQKAVALKYNPEKNGAPIIVASGMGYMAERITETALEAGVPVYEDDSLATLLTQLKLGSEIPRELYQAIVEIYIYFLGFVPEKPEEGLSGDNLSQEHLEAEDQELAGTAEGGETEGGFLPESQTPGSATLRSAGRKK